MGAALGSNGINSIEIKISKHCQSWGQCVFDAPEIFNLVEGERKTWKYETDSRYLEKLKSAVAHCPNNAISYTIKEEI